MQMSKQLRQIFVRALSGQENSKSMTPMTLSGPSELLRFPGTVRVVLSCPWAARVNLSPFGTTGAALFIYTMI